MSLTKFSSPSDSLIVNRTINIFCLNDSKKYNIDLLDESLEKKIYESSEYLKDIFMNFIVKKYILNSHIDDIKRSLVNYIRIFFIDFIEYISENDCQNLPDFGVTIHNMINKIELNGKKGLIVGKKMDKYIVNIDNKKYLINRNNIFYNFDYDIIKLSYEIDNTFDKLVEIKTIILNSMVFKNNYKLMTSTDLKDFELEEFKKNETQFYCNGKKCTLEKYKNILNIKNKNNITVEPKIEIKLDESKSKIEKVNIGLILKKVY